MDMCEVDWSALGTWVTGLAVIVLAWQANRIQLALKGAQERQSEASADAAAAAIYVELINLRGRANGLLRGKAATQGLPIRAQYATLDGFPSFALSEQITSSDTLGALPAPLARRIGAMRGFAEEMQVRAAFARGLMHMPGSADESSPEINNMLATGMGMVDMELPNYISNLDTAIRALELHFPECKKLIPEDHWTHDPRAQSPSAVGTNLGQSPQFRPLSDNADRRLSD